MGLLDGLSNLFGRGSSDAKLQDQIFNLKFTAKSLARAAKKCEKEERENKTKVKRAIEKGNIDGAKIHAQDAIRKKNEGLNMLRLASRLDGVVARLETQAKMNAVNKDMSGIVKSLERSLNTNNLEKVAENMDLFEKQFENLDVQTEFVESAMGNTSALSTPPEEVATLMQQIADEHGLEFATDLPSAGSTRVAEQREKADDLTARLEGLKGGA
ncbi:Snf7 [Ostreococcus tauri]|uniref:Snf7 n=1 Tax=Ostreococcus tauri TaxID=70448 RepID=A0A090N2V2_OSTTA|nr:Snf7 [Ostreococcus tauri]OUS42398.1 Snf7-domain-containing protein [Ostreococcus tauri]CEF96883.1 Snf7 [Ostreococcus tauri]|eukprot:XP_022838357.1 Snf7 [Ostreococcus tauri]